ncbi:hypothetical protein BJX70DRAFT_398151 [Aspergillus crustosus]
MSLILLSIAALAPVALAQDICSFNTFEASTWHASGADQYLEDWFKDHNYDEHDWLYKMDAETTGNGDGNSAVDCKNLYGSGTCAAPQVQCKDFTPNQYYYVRQMAAQFNQHLTTAHEWLQDYTIANALGIDQMISDLSVQDNNKDFMKLLISSFTGFASMAGSVMGAYPAAASVVGVIGGGMIVTNANYRFNTGVPTTDDIKRQVENWVAAYFWETRESIKKIQNRMFGGSEVDSDTDILDDLLNVVGQLGLDDSGYSSKISKVLSTGAFLVSVGESDITAAMETGFKMMKKRIIGNLLTASNIAVFKVRMNEEKYCQNYGDRYIDGNCYQLYHPVSGHMQPVDSNILNHLEFTYDIDPAALYVNTDRCDNSFQDGWNNRVGLEPDEFGYTPCFFDMIIMRAWEKDCVKSNWKYPDWWRHIQSDMPCRQGTS